MESRPVLWVTMEAMEAILQLPPLGLPLRSHVAESIVTVATITTVPTWCNVLAILTSACHPEPVAGKTLTDQLRDAVRRSAVTRYRLSLELGIDQAALSRFVNGERGLSLEAIDKLAAFLKLRLVGPQCGKERRP